MSQCKHTSAFVPAGPSGALLAAERRRMDTVGMSALLRSQRCHVRTCPQERQVADLVGAAKANKQQALDELRMELEAQATEVASKAAAQASELQAAIDRQHQELLQVHKAQSRDRLAAALAARAALRRVLREWGLSVEEHRAARCVSASHVTDCAFFVVITYIWA